MTMLLLNKNQGASYILNEKFDSQASCVLTFVDTNNVLSFSGGQLIHGGGGAGTNDPNGYYLTQLTRAAGLAMFFSIDGTGGSLGKSWWGFEDSAPAVRPLNSSIYLDTSGNTTRAYDSGTVIQGVPISMTGAYKGGVVIQDSGQFAYIKGEAFTEWTLIWAGVTDAIANLYAGFGGSANDKWALNWLRIAQLGYPYNTAYATATSRNAGSVSAGTTFAHEADAFIEFEADALPTNDEEIIDFRFRIQDATNYWQLTIDDDGDMVLNEVVAGVSTSRGTDAGHVAAGDRIGIWFRDETIAITEANNRRITYPSAANFKTATSGEVEALATGSAVKDVIAYPVTPSGSALTLLNKYTS